MVTGESLSTVSKVILGNFLNASTTPARCRAHRVARRAAHEHDIAFAMNGFGDPLTPSNPGRMIVPVEILDVVLAVLPARIRSPGHDLHPGVRRRPQRRQLRLARVGNNDDRITP